MKKTDVTLKRPFNIRQIGNIQNHFKMKKCRIKPSDLYWTLKIICVLIEIVRQIFSM